MLCFPPCITLIHGRPFSPSLFNLFLPPSSFHPFLSLCPLPSLYLKGTAPGSWRDLPSTGSLPKCPLQPGLVGRLMARNLEFPTGSPTWVTETPPPPQKSFQDWTQKAGLEVDYLRFVQLWSSTFP